MFVPHEILVKYIEHRKRDLEVCLTFVKNHQYNEIETIGHQIKGNGLTFGYPELSIIGKKLEEGAHSKNLEILRSTLKELSNWIKTRY